MQVTIKSLGVIFGTIVAAAGVITAAYNFVIWVDDIYVDNHELEIMIDGQTDILNIMNDNIINVGSAIYDRKIDEIDQWIKDLSTRENMNNAESAFLITLKEQRIDVLAKKAQLSKIQVGF